MRLLTPGPCDSRAPSRTCTQVIAVNQDPLGVAGDLVHSEGQLEVYAAPMADGSRAVVMLNAGSGDGNFAKKEPMEVSLSEVQWAHGVRAGLYVISRCAPSCGAGQVCRIKDASHRNSRCAAVALRVAGLQRRYCGYRPRPVRQKGTASAAPCMVLCRH